MEIKQGKALTLIPPAPGLCQVCAAKHHPDMMHNRDSLYYGTAFMQEHGREPTWSDAIAHCEPSLKLEYRIVLRDMYLQLGRNIPEDLIEKLDPKVDRVQLFRLRGFFGAEDAPDGFIKLQDDTHPFTIELPFEVSYLIGKAPLGRRTMVAQSYMREYYADKYNALIVSAVWPR